MNTVLSGQLPEKGWESASTHELITYLVEHFHTRHREQLPELITLARRVEHVHHTSSQCPIGLADILENLQQELESHMLKEEQVLFPMLLQGKYAAAKAPVSVMRIEHQAHDRALADIALVSNNITLPEGACNTWRKLYSLLDQFRADLIKHIELENDVLFLNASNAAEGAHHG